MTEDDLAVLDAVGQAELVRSGAATPLELVDSAIDRITASNPVINAVTWERFDEARKHAQQGHTGDAPFAGVPLLLKDLGCPAAGFPDHQGSIALKERENVCDHDSSMVRRFKDAGFVILGRTNVPEFGLISDTQNRAYGVTANPWNTAHTCGGSSGGSAAAVASGMVPVAHGNDGGGSIRIPASHCGLVGLKTSRGLISHAPDAGDPMFGHVSSGVLTRSVRDTAHLVDILAGREPGDPTTPAAPTGRYSDALSRPSRRLRIGFVDQPAGPKYGPHPDVLQAVSTAAELLAGLGHEVEQNHPGAMFEEQYWSKWFDALSPTVTSAVDWVRGIDPARPAEFDAVTMLWADHGRGMTASDLAETLDWLDAYRRRLAGWWAGGFDLLLCPTMVTPPPVLGWLWSYPEGIRDSVDILQFTPQFNSTGQPAISVPMTWTDDNLPVGVQLVATYGQDALLLQVAAEIEAARPWASRYPAVAQSSAGKDS
jgi:amidase